MSLIKIKSEFVANKAWWTTFTYCLTGPSARPVHPQWNYGNLRDENVIVITTA